MSIKDLSLKLAAITLIEQSAKKAKDELRQQLKAEMDKVGADRVKAELSGQSIAYVTTSKPKFKWEITNQRQFINWVKDYFPTEIIESVRESSMDMLMDKLSYMDDQVIDHNGEFIDWAVGGESEPYLVTKFHGDGKELLTAALVQKTIEPLKVLELE